MVGAGCGCGCISVSGDLEQSIHSHPWGHGAVFHCQFPAHSSIQLVRPGLQTTNHPLSGCLHGPLSLINNHIHLSAHITIIFGQHFQELSQNRQVRPSMLEAHQCRRKYTRSNCRPFTATLSPFAQMRTPVLVHYAVSLISLCNGGPPL
ncbi:hypothetical protein FIBSPDRAFT_99674 [Athelia psychrophila]|uniref:Uncharacterized protein n=1 Tax=Athelia psychrophila TaxID=1759441 RepID=A0A166DMK9_9AGAM|nr:hypothetical protein FIBSPDRAFT_99674 [Fibularhizoctonia sp. CBS 109695]